MKPLVICTIILSVFIGCNKQKLYSKKLDGAWTIVSYSRTNNEGLTSKTSYCQGNINFHIDSNIFDLNINYILDGINDTSIAYGSCQLVEDGSEIIFSNSVGLNLEGNGNYRILTLNNSDLQIEGGDSLGNVNTYLFSKKF
jgi:hypothetical protein